MSLSLAACGKGCFQKSGPRDSFALIPSDTNAVMGMNWKKVQTSPLGPKMLEGMKETRNLLQDKDIDVVIGFKVQGSNQQPVAVGVATGNLEPSAVIDEMKRQAEKASTTLENETYEDTKIYYTAKDPSFGLAMLGNQAIFGTKDVVKRSLDLDKKKGESLLQNKPMMDLVGTIDRNKMLWAVGKVPDGLAPTAPAGTANPMEALSSVKAFDLTVDYQQDLAIDLGLTTPSEEEAKKIVSVVDGLKMLFGGFMSAQKPELGKFVSTLPMTVKGNKAVLALKLDKATMDKLEAESKQVPAPAAPTTEPAPATP